MASLLLHFSLRPLSLTSPILSGSVKAYSQVVAAEAARRSSSGIGAKARSTADEFDSLNAEKMARFMKERANMDIIRQNSNEAAGRSPKISKEKVMISDIEV